MSIATKTGDDGTTALLFGHRVPKTHPRVVACGCVDELNAALGLARAFLEGFEEIGAELVAIQQELVTLMGELALLPEDRARYLQGGHCFLEAAAGERLTGRILELERDAQISYRHWATPGATRASAFFDQARTVCRRAERAVLELRAGEGELNAEVLRYLNRLSDLCWLYARLIETRAGLGQP